MLAQQRLSPTSWHSVLSQQSWHLPVIAQQFWPWLQLTPSSRQLPLSHETVLHAGAGPHSLADVHSLAVQPPLRGSQACPRGQLSGFGSCRQVRKPSAVALQVSSVQATPSSAQSVDAQHSPHVADLPSGLLQQLSPAAQSEDFSHSWFALQVLGLHASWGHCESPQQAPQPNPAQQLPPSGQVGWSHW